MKITDIRENPDNPRVIKDHKFKQLVKSIKEFPQMLELRPIVVDSNNIVLGGNMRLKACKEAGLKDVPVLVADKLTDEQKKEFIIKDNVGFGEWDWDILANEWDAELLDEWGMDLPKFPEENILKDLSDEINSSYRLEVELENEEEQEKLYNELIEKGYICRLLTL